MLPWFRSICQCSNAKVPKFSQRATSVLQYYTSGKTTVAVSQMLVSGAKAIEELYPNYYIREEMCNQLESLAPGFTTKCVEQSVDGQNLRSIFRILVRAHIGQKDIVLNINSLKANPYLKKLIELKDSKRFISKTSQVIIVHLILFRMMRLSKRKEKIWNTC